MKRIPIKIAKEIAEKYGYDQVVILAQKDVDKKNIIKGWSATYNTDKKECKHLGEVAAIQSHNLRCYYKSRDLVEDATRRLKEDE
jgi:hypothetical protein